MPAIDFWEILKNSLQVTTAIYTLADSMRISFLGMLLPTGIASFLVKTFPIVSVAIKVLRKF